jgi:hypothetical protein
MPVIGARPVSGVRIDVERPHHAAAPWPYTGAIATPERDFDVRASIAADGEVAVETDAPADVAEKARLILRAAWKHADGEAPPRRIQRWRGEK